MVVAPRRSTRAGCSRYGISALLGLALPEQLLESQGSDIAIFPLAFPMLAGPGAIANAMMQTSGVDTLWQKTAIYIAIALASLATLLVLLVASVAERRLGKTGLSVLERVMGLVLAAVAVQFIVDGIGEVLPALRIASAR